MMSNMHYAIGLAIVLAVIALVLIVGHALVPMPPAHTFDPFGLGTAGSGVQAGADA